MRIALLGLAAACAVISAPGAAETSWSGHHGGGAHRGHHDGGGDGFEIHPGDSRFSDRIDLRRDRRRDNSNLVLDSYGGEWALYNNRSWEPDSYNDWWHDRPDRAFPRWMQRNQDCSRQWYSGDTLRC